MNKMNFIRTDFQKKFHTLIQDENTPLLQEWFEEVFSEDNMIANWKSENLKKRMIVQESPEDEPLHFDAFTDKGGENYDYDDLCIQAVSVNEKTDLLYRIYKLWFIENRSSDEINKILQGYMKKLNPVSVYIEPELSDFLIKLAAKQDTDVERIVNEWIRKDIEIIQAANMEM